MTTTLRKYVSALTIVAAIALGFGGVLVAPTTAASQGIGDLCGWVTGSDCVGNDCVTEMGNCCPQPWNVEECA